MKSGSYTAGAGKMHRRVYCGDELLEASEVAARLNRQEETIAKLEKIMRQQDRLLEAAIAEAARLKRQFEMAAERIAAQSELLSR